MTDAPYDAPSALVSVVIPCYNQAEWLAEAIESVLSQTHRAREVVVVDDGSTDGSARVAARYPDVRCVRQANRGASRARNTGLRASRGAYVVFLDADDRLLPHALEVGVRELRAAPECAFTAGLYVLVSEAGREVPVRARPRTDHYQELLRGNYVGMPATAIFRRAALVDAGGFAPAVDFCEDYDLLLRIARRHPVACHSEIVAEYRMHGENRSRHAPRMLRDALRVLRRQRGQLRGAAEREAWQAGVEYYRRYYGKPILDAMRADERARRWGRVMRGCWALARWYPVGLRHHLRSKAAGALRRVARRGAGGTRGGDGQGSSTSRDRP